MYIRIQSIWEVVHVYKVRIIYHGKNIMGNVYGIKSKRDKKFMGSKYQNKKYMGKNKKIRSVGKECVRMIKSI